MTLILVTITSHATSDITAQYAGVLSCTSSEMSRKVFYFYCMCFIEHKRRGCISVSLLFFLLLEIFWTAWQSIAGISHTHTHRMLQLNSGAAHFKVHISRLYVILKIEEAVPPRAPQNSVFSYPNLVRFLGFIYLFIYF